MEYASRLAFLFLIAFVLYLPRGVVMWDNAIFSEGL